jgi:hypothetical protein
MQNACVTTERRRSPSSRGPARAVLRSAIVLAALLAAFLSAVTARASSWAELPQLCDQAAARASAASGVPLSVLRAIALTETGRTRDGSFRPWPWTVNMEGKGAWFDSFEEARDYVARRHAAGARSYDVGCFQINYRWHGQHFATLDQMFDPDANAAYAARFLGELYAEFGDWSRAAGAYHSRTPYFAAKYRQRFERIRGRLVAADGEDAPVALAAAPAEPVPPPATVAPIVPPGRADEVEIRDNRFPLLVDTGAARGLSSLVPLEIVANARLIDADEPPRPLQ